MTATMAEVAKEAVCSALYNMPFTRFMGERPCPGYEGDVAFFTLCRDPEVPVSVQFDPKQVKVRVGLDGEMDTGFILLHVAWLNISGPAPLVSQQIFRIPTNLVSEADVRLATEQVVTRILKIYADVLEGVGVAGPPEALAPESEAEDVDPETDMAATDAEAGRE